MQKILGGGVVCSIVWGGGGISCAFLGGGGGVRNSTNFIGGGVIVLLCDMCGEGYSLYKFVQNVGGGEV